MLAGLHAALHRSGRARMGAQRSLAHWLGASRHAVNDVHEWLTVLDVTVCQSSRHAPSLGCGFLGQNSDVGTFLFNSNDIASKYFLSFYPLFVSRRYQVTGFWP